MLGTHLRSQCYVLLLALIVVNAFTIDSLQSELQPIGVIGHKHTSDIVTETKVSASLTVVTDSEVSTYNPQSGPS